MSYTHPRFGIVTPDNQTKAKDLGAELKQMGATIENVLGLFDYNGADPNVVLARVAALEAILAPLVPTPWEPATLANPSWQQAAYPFQLQLVGDRVFLSWGINGSQLTPNAVHTVATIPEKFRPNGHRYFQAPGNTASNGCRVNITATGQVIVSTGPTVPSYVIFDGLNYEKARN